MKDGGTSIDGQRLMPHPGETILQAARRAGIEIPHVCWSEGLAPEGGCRVCLVEVAGATRPVAACHTHLEPGMQVRTETPRLDRLRREILTLMADPHPAGAFTDVAAATPFGRLLQRYGMVANGTHPRRRGDLDGAHPYLHFDPSLCIVCRLCVHACEEVQGSFVYGVGGRGAHTTLRIGALDRYTPSACTACGACVDRCPTGAVTDRDRLDRAEADKITATVCGYCGTGCRIEVATRGEEVLRVEGVRDAAVNRGHLCAKGRFAHGWHSAGDRLTRPLLRRAGELVPVSWAEAIAFAAGRLRALRSAHGSDAVACLTSSRSTNEAAYLLQKLFRCAFGTNHIDCCARVCHSSTALAMGRMTGTSAASTSFHDLELARCLVVAGTNPTEAHPVVGARIVQAVLRGADLIVIDPRCTALAEYATLHLQPRPGTNVALLHGLAKALLETGALDRAYVAERTEGLAELETFLAGLPLADAARISGVAETDLRAAARILGRGPALFVHGLGLSEQTQGVAAVEALCNLALLTGSLGRAGAGMMPLRGQNNVQGNADMGAMPDALTGYQRVGDAEVRARFAALWGVPPPATPGWTVSEMFAAARDRRLKALWIQGEDPMQSHPEPERVREALGSLDFLAVQELFLTDTARLAHLVLPAAGCLEQDGTFTNAERRIQRVRAAVPPPGEARPDWQVFVELARALGLRWNYRHPGEVMDEIARAAPALFGGVHYDRLEGDGLLWPCPDATHPGTLTLHLGGFPCGRARFRAVPYLPPPELDVPGHPYTLITGRVLQHYNVGTMTRRTQQLELEPEDRLEIHPEDARREGLVDGGRARVTSRTGECVVRVRCTARVAPGTLFLSFHHPQTRTNALVGPHHDPESKCPDYKTVAVRLRPE